MKSWPIKKLGEIVVHSVNSPKIKKDDYKNIGKFPIIDQSQSFIAGYTDNEKYLYSGDLPVIIFGDHTQVIKYVDKPFARGADGTKVITADINQTDTKFLFFLMSNLKLESHGYSRHFQYLVEKELTIPPLKAQKKIVERLDAIRKAQELCDQQIKKTEEIFESILEKELNKLDEVDIKKLSEVCDVRDGTHDSPKYQNSGIPLITSKNLKDNEIDFSNVNYISEKDHEQIIKRSFVENGDILFGMIGTIGNPIIVDTDIKFSIKNVGLIKFPNKTINNYFVKYYLQSKKLKNQIKRWARGGTQKFVSLGNLRDLPITVPLISQQQKIVEKLEAVQNYKKLLQKEKTLLKELFDSVLDKSMKGELAG